MTLIDRDGRVFGRFNLIDLAVVAFVVLLLPISFATFLLFRPSRPVIESVTRVEVTNEERRVSGAGLIMAKLKVKGNGFNPLHRAMIGSTPALGFVFETPNSADVIVGVVPPGKHDLVLMDGVQEVARARDAVEIQATVGPSIRAFGWLTDLSPGTAATLEPGYATDANLPGAFRIIAVGPVRPAKARLSIGTRATDLPLRPGQVERAAELVLRCDWPSARTCTVGGESLRESPPIAMTLPGGIRFEIEAIDAAGEATPAVAVLRLERPLPGVKVGDRDANVSASAAEITAVAGSTVTLKLGVHDSREGWRYRGQLVMPGATFTLRTDAHLLIGTIEEFRTSRP
jgi:hypothetical protein